MDPVSREIERKLQLMEEEISKDPERFTEPEKKNIFDFSRGIYHDRGDGWVEVSGAGYKFANSTNSVSFDWGKTSPNTYYSSTA